LLSLLFLRGLGACCGDIVRSSSFVRRIIFGASRTFHTIATQTVTEVDYAFGTIRIAGTGTRYHTRECHTVRAYPHLQRRSPCLNCLSLQPVLQD
jgi:hypothetical protein